MQIVFKKPDDATQFYQSPQSVKDYIKTTYIDTGLLIENVNHTNGKKTRTMTFTFATPEAEAQYKADATLRANAAARKAYNAEHGITEEQA